MAKKCRARRDTLLFGADKTAGGSVEAQAAVPARHFVNEKDSFELPGSELRRTSQGHIQLLIQGECICEDMSRYM